MTIIDNFKKICAIPHCSHHAGELKAFLEEEGRKHGYTVSSDTVGNVLCSHENANVILQAHYDMVCIGEAPNLQLYEEEGLLKAKESSLGADNGMGMAMMLTLMQESAPVSCLFTADEEVGLIGANSITLPIKETKMLNLDTEEEGFVYIGCAGGADVVATRPLHLESIQEDVESYEVVVDGLPGGHSGVDIHKNIPSSIKHLAAFLVHVPHYLITIEGGERRNSIPRKARAVVSVPKGVILDSDLPHVHVKKLPDVHQQAMTHGAQIIQMIHAFAQGVRAMNPELGIVQNSINLALVETNSQEVKVTLSARSMDADELQNLVDETRCFFKAFDFHAISEGGYVPWKPEVNSFAQEVQSECLKHFDNADFTAIHAGLECAVLKAYAPHLEIASIGPNIYDPHSSRESVEVASVERVFNVVKAIVEANA